MTTITTAPDISTAAPDENQISALQDSLVVMESMYLYNHWIFSNIRPFIGDRILEVGSGTGNITSFLLGYSRVVALEPDLAGARKAAQRFNHHRNVQVIQGTLEDYNYQTDGDESFDTVICLNVLEHIEDDIHALRCMKQQITAEGKVIILVPALKSLYGSLDRSLGHFRRYNKRHLLKIFHQADLEVVKSFYMNLPGVLGWFLHSRILHRKHIALQSARKFENVVPYIMATESAFKPPLGQSLIMVGQPKR